ncbi:MAG TPA: hypothetical protein VFB32_12960 [Rudaea sp.]|nr:hypothetical protein [Rudaea sp.]
MEGGGDRERHVACVIDGNAAGDEEVLYAYGEPCAAEKAQAVDTVLALCFGDNASELVAVGQHPPTLGSAFAFHGGAHAIGDVAGEPADTPESQEPMSLRHIVSLSARDV